MFDFDDNDFEKLNEFIAGIYDDNDFDDDDISYQKTPNGYAVVVEHGFDSRGVLERWPNVELKRDGMLFVGAMKNE